MNKTGFTLIELLVVVLIIGILSAVALPQYQKTVLKSRTAEAWTTLNAIRTAVNAYCLENPKGGGYFSDLKDSFPIEIQDSKYFTYWGPISCNGFSVYSIPADISATYQGGNKNLKLAYNRSGQRVCEGSSCKEIGFTKVLSGSMNCIACGGTGSCYYID